MKALLANGSCLILCLGSLVTLPMPVSGQTYFTCSDLYAAQNTVALAEGARNNINEFAEEQSAEVDRQACYRNTNGVKAEDMDFHLDNCDWEFDQALQAIKDKVEQAEMDIAFTQQQLSVIEGQIATSGLSC